MTNTSNERRNILVNGRDTYVVGPCCDTRYCEHFERYQTRVCYVCHRAEGQPHTSDCSVMLGILDDLPTIEDAMLCPDCGEPGPHDRCNLLSGSRFRATIEHVEPHERHNAVMALIEGIAGFCR